MVVEVRPTYACFHSQEVKVEVKMSELVIMDEPKEEVEVLVSKYTNIKPIHYY